MMPKQGISGDLQLFKRRDQNMLLHIQQVWKKSELEALLIMEVGVFVAIIFVLFLLLLF